MTDPGVPVSKTLESFKHQVEERSAGKLKIIIHYSSSLIPEAVNHDAVASGAVEMGVVNLPNYATTIPVADAFQLPFVFNTGELERKATSPGNEARALIEREILKGKNSRVLWWIPVGQTVFLSHDASVADPARLVGKTVRTFAPTIEAVVTKCGGRPRDLRAKAQEAAYERHEVDVGMAGISTVVGRRLWRFMNTLTRTNHASVHNVVVINENFWRMLGVEHRNIISDASHAANAEARAVLTDVDSKADRDLAEGKGTKIVELTAEELQLWRACSSDVLLEFLDRAGPAGRELVEAYGRMRVGLSQSGESAESSSVPGFPTR
jgi:C4-dicarboxylate-binding protein DctP